MNFRNVQDALATKGIELRRGKAPDGSSDKLVDAYILDRGHDTALMVLPVSEYDMLDVLHEGLRLN